MEPMIHAGTREFRATGISVQRGEVLVPRLIGVDAQGVLSCGGAPLVAGSLTRKGCQVRLAPVPRCDDPAGNDATVFLATWQQDDGLTLTLAAVTAPQDKLAAAHARAAVEEWTAAAGARTVLAGPSPWCSGAVGAIEACRRAAAEYAGTAHTVRLLTPVPMPPESAAELATLGAVEASSLADAQPGDVIVIPAHGAATEIRVEAAERKLTIVDATCPLVARAQDKVSRLADRGQHIALISQPGAAATGPIASRAGGRVTVVESVAGAGTMHAADSRQVSYMVQPGMPVEAASGIVGALRARYPSARDPLPGGTCYAASDRAATARTIAAGSDLVLLLGNAQSADIRQLAAQARETGVKVQPVSAVADITPAMLTGVSTVGVVESTSAPAVLATEIIAALAGLGPLTVARRQVSTEIAGQPG
jgi:4-hydroxy-3-methylbut-2-en-1-yl diphosphate reductase